MMRASSGIASLLIGLHDRILAGNLGAGAGRFRTSGAYVVDNRTSQLLSRPPLPGGRRTEILDGACAAMQAGFQHPAIGATWIHVAVAAIHPFKDGNGRAARVVASLAMYRGGFKCAEFTSLEEWWGRHQAEYYAAFRCLGERFDPDADITPFIRAHLEAQLHQVRALDLRERVQHRIWTAVEEAVTAAGLAPRVREKRVWDVFFGRGVTPRYYRPRRCERRDGHERFRLGRRGRPSASGGQGAVTDYRRRGPLSRIGAALGVRVDESGESARTLHHWRADETRGVRRAEIDWCTTRSR